MSAVARFRPLFDRVLIQRVAAETRTKGGVILPEKAQSRANEGTVVAVGPGGRTQAGEVIPISVQVGDTVLLPEYGGSAIKLDDKEYQLFRDSDLLGIFSK
eukprot:comp10693_c0_seq1/m.5364 comp10693_c0_seq1/g.5364  ORF comp10693_c0_seq1/g.5364 comp10693_c0_seq1/m.5364 type:complete len:101 (-) comp10693_c0_seq1:312-614(-)